MLKLQDVTVRLGGRVILNEFNLDVNAGSVAAIMGPSGCGKSTALKSILRLVEPEAGTVSWMGNNILRMDDMALERFRAGVGFVFQRSNLISRLSAVSNVMLPMVAAGMHTNNARSLAMKALEKVGMSQCAEYGVEGLSGGEMQRVAIARAIAAHPRLVLWDEPTASLDPTLVVDVLTLIESLVRCLDATMVVVTHEAGFALRVADQLVFMESGTVVEKGCPYALLSDPKSDVGRRYARALAYTSPVVKEIRRAL